MSKFNFKLKSLEHGFKKLYKLLKFLQSALKKKYDKNPFYPSNLCTYLSKLAHRHIDKLNIIITFVR